LVVQKHRRQRIASLFFQRGGGGAEFGKWGGPVEFFNNYLGIPTFELFMKMSKKILLM
jgi:hypothetical protein